VAETTTSFGGPLTTGELEAALARTPLPAVTRYPLWPLQFRFVRDVIILVGLIGFVSLVAMFTIWWERKVAGRIQSRVGPMRVGCWHGWAQSPADGMKLILKEDLVPAEADRPLFRAAPYLAFVPVLTAYVALPFGAAWVFRDLAVALLFILSMLGIEVVGVIVAGWASNNKWGVYGAMREACQMVSYEIPMGMALLIPIMCVGSLKLSAIGEAQSGGWFTWLAFRNPFVFAAALSYYIAALANCKRAPFDLPEGESELVAGFHTEYSGMRWSFFFFAEYASMFMVCALATILFFGAWHSPLPASWADAMGDSLPAQALKGVLFSGPIWLILKATFLVYVQIWLRWTLPRIRIDQVLYACIQVMLPMCMVLLLGSTLWELFATLSSEFASLSTVATILLGAVGVLPVLGFLAFMLYGLIYRRWLVGTLVVDHLPGS